jgi:phosphomannomutase/phosphoglucomutase
MWKTGHSLIKEKMLAENAALAGEMSGHIFFADGYYGYDDAIYASLRLLKILVDSQKTISQLLADVQPMVSTPEIRMDCPDSKKFQVVEKIKAHFKSTHEVIDIDGARIKFAHGWGLVRASNTQPALVMRFEADEEDQLQKIQHTVEGAVHDFIG